MRKSLLLPFSVLGLSLVGCGTSTCDKLITGLESLRDKGGECVTEVEIAFFNQRIEEAQQECEGEEEDPLAARKESIEAFDECVGELEDCSGDELDAWAEGANACLTGLD